MDAELREAHERALRGLTPSKESIRRAVAFISSRSDERQMFQLASDVIARMAAAESAAARLPLFCVLDSVCQKAKSAKRADFLALMQPNLTVALSVVLRRVDGGDEHADERATRQLVGRVLDNWRRQRVFDEDALCQADAQLGATRVDGDGDDRAGARAPDAAGASPLGAALDALGSSPLDAAGGGAGGESDDSQQQLLELLGASEDNGALTGANGRAAGRARARGDGGTGDAIVNGGSPLSLGSSLQSSPEAVGGLSLIHI